MEPCASKTERETIFSDAINSICSCCLFNSFIKASNNLESDSLRLSEKKFVKPSYCVVLSVSDIFFKNSL